MGCTFTPTYAPTSAACHLHLQTWFRCWIMCMALYFGVGAVWCYYAYFAFGEQRQLLRHKLT